MCYLPGFLLLLTSLMKSWWADTTTVLAIISYVDLRWGLKNIVMQAGKKKAMEKFLMTALPKALKWRQYFKIKKPSNVECNIENKSSDERKNSKLNITEKLLIAANFTFFLHHILIYQLFITLYKIVMDWAIVMIECTITRTTDHSYVSIMLPYVGYSTNNLWTTMWDMTLSNILQEHATKEKSIFNQQFYIYYIFQRSSEIILIPNISNLDLFGLMTVPLLNLVKSGETGKRT